jgi:hypothetical protein
MKKSWKTGLIVVACFGFASIMGIVLGAPAASAQGPLDVTLTGKFLTDKEKGDAETYFFYVRDKKMRFQVRHVEVPPVAPQSASGTEILVEIGTPRIHVSGTDSAMKQLQQPDLPGKSFKIVGTLYVADAILMVTSVEKLK